MSNRNLLLNLIESENPNNKKYYDFLKGAYDSRFYHYGSHFKQHEEKTLGVKKSLLRKVMFLLSGVFVFFMSLKKRKKEPTIFSTSYFNTDTYFKDTYSFNMSRPPWAYNGRLDNVFSYELFKKSKELKKDLKHKNFSYLISEAFISKVKIYEEELKAFILHNNVVALFVSNDIGFFEKLSISIFRDLGLPSFAFVHGLQFWLNDYDWKRTDYLVLWGTLSKQDFVKNGFNGERILVSGHPNKTIIKKKHLKFDLDDILVLANSLNGIHPSNEYYLSDRSNCIYYLYLIQSCLKELNVSKVRFRPHPSENLEWYKKNIDLTFYEIDEFDLNSSLDAATLVIGPTSTVFFDVLERGVNYVVFEPQNQFGLGLYGFRTPSMYNGDNSKVPVAKSKEELRDLLNNKTKVDISILDDVCNANFDVEQVYLIINKSIKSVNL